MVSRTGSSEIDCYEKSSGLTWLVGMGTEKLFIDSPSTSILRCIIFDAYISYEREKRECYGRNVRYPMGAPRGGIVFTHGHELVQMAYEGCLRSCEGQKRRKEPFSVKVIKKFVDIFSGRDRNLKEQRFSILSPLCFAGIFRKDELLSVQLKHVALSLSQMEIYLLHA